MLQTYWKSFLHILFPQLCAGCDCVLLHQEEVLCTNCLFHLPKTDFHLDEENDTARQLWGKLRVEHAVSMLYVAKDSIVSNMVHKLKYQNQPKIGIYLGQQYGEILSETEWIKSVDAIVPIPIHPQKLRKRGYNQALQFAKGLSRTLDIPTAEDILVRRIASVSQTQKSRTERYDNVDQVFYCPKSDLPEPKHILLVDDVMTTGATIASAGNVLIDTYNLKVSVATIARAK